MADLDFRRHVSFFATGVAVISGEDAAGSVHGVTVNSFGSVSLEPPTVMVSLRPGRAMEIVESTGRYGASILTQSQQHASNHFAGNRDNSEQPTFLTRLEVPTLETCLAWFECEVLDSFTVNDHVLFPARVTACGSAEGDPLIFFASQYHSSPNRLG
ncbi:styrene monooxygenase NADH-dependent flavin reductase subunit StyB [Aeromicrobium sp. Root495]|uniref:styrene monooxygenase NADH-dependent flavin reductase subunit StyB n=1 Tax=Aeromicrobium sp. Root495 TaxID=1736550 RepID=UPI00190FCA2A|nr:flavin reductase family protein [Aeromicrobium sp. Root495]